ncbi:DUF445 domain-containing protein [Vibrio caribbeanicus]|uniref:DUF445 domain-containing protein n=1 Tax=Vibrio caribbeanicus ATCC BAA-2122 TaxID=796620 RepID=E3BJF3_9VIBR|nr:hypothetical protein [Vibrio caribbeanicus]EFP96722.1 hypothetical protein VIBC2010_07129 [Vibrio caribbeanicus ATCC BAA-2122]MCY9844125.1 DUF445 domain-containing protein [Vibrio caribbeanicus]
MNKSFATNFIALAVLAAGYQLNNQVLLYAGLFAFSGAITNWLAIHMLFEKIPGLYGSGVIPARFEEFKLAIKTLMMEQFFTDENIDKFISKELSSNQSFDLEPIISKVDLSPAFDSLVNVISQSSFGGMLSMIGGTEALQPLKQPFVDRMKLSLVDMSKTDNVREALKDQLETPEMLADIKVKVENIIDQRLEELTPKLVKEMVQKMIKQHLGWLVVWGGVFGGLIGVLSSFVA